MSSIETFFIFTYVLAEEIKWASHCESSLSLCSRDNKIKLDTVMNRLKYIRDFKIQYGEALVRLMQRKETGPTTPSPAKTQID